MNVMPNSPMQRLKRYFVTGLIVLIPATLTIFIIFETFNRVDKLIPYKMLGIPRIPGLGILTLLIIILFTGMVAHNYLGRKLLSTGDKIVSRIPVISRLYEGLKQIINAIFSEKSELFKRVVLFEYPRKGIYSIGFFTQDTRGPVQDQIQEDVVSVFLPTTPNPTSGYLLFVPKREMTVLDMSVEQAMKLIISGGAIATESSRLSPKIGMHKNIDLNEQTIKTRA
ncbi:DUF502 domain-containing protein [candidate division KSB1 bacterium]|nr:DUF502 domain-containing protein [candidate division KSB1 bacterium]